MHCETFSQWCEDDHPLPTYSSWTWTWLLKRWRKGTGRTHKRSLAEKRPSHCFVFFFSPMQFWIGCVLHVLCSFFFLSIGCVTSLQHRQVHHWWQDTYKSYSHVYRLVMTATLMKEKKQQLQQRENKIHRLLNPIVEKGRGKWSSVLVHLGPKFSTVHFRKIPVNLH